MRKSIKIAISLPSNLHRAAERERKRRRQTRSEFFRRAAEALLRRESARKAEERYIQGYLNQPEDEAEIAEARRLSMDAFADERWE